MSNLALFLRPLTYSGNDVPAVRSASISFPMSEKIVLFRGLPELDLALLAAASRERRYRRDASVFLKDDCPTGAFAVLEGTVALVCLSTHGRERVIALVGPGQFFGESPLLLGRPYPYMARALTRVSLLHVDGVVLGELIATSPEFGRRMLAQVADNVCAVSDDLESYRTHAPNGRVARFLLELGKAARLQDLAIKFPAPKQTIASRLGMTPESFSRCLRDLVDAGLIEVGRDKVRLVNRTQLAALAK